MVQFLYQGGYGSHGPRAEALAAVTHGSKVSEVSSKASAVQDLDTLTFWGHGDSHQLCGQGVDEIHSVIQAWKKLNPGLKTVEIITCNARHALNGDPFATRLKNSFGYWSGTSDITLKALPTTVTGKNNAWSILLAETIHKSWVYVTAPGLDDKLLMEASSLIRFEETASGGKVSYRGDIATRADQAVRNNPNRSWTMNYGYFNTLRACLGRV
jgi:hypothetical protein